MNQEPKLSEFAFPGNGYGGGMTLRDYFAAKAMQGIFANGCTHSPEELARVCYVAADAMLEERNKT